MIYYYPANLFFALGLVAAMLVYMANFDPDSRKTRAFQRYLAGVLLWAFFDTAVSYIHRASPGTAGFDAYRYLSFLFLFFPPARKEKMLLFWGGMATVAGIALVQVAKIHFGEPFPWMANTATAFTSLAAFWGMKRYGRVLSPRVLYETTVHLMPGGLVHLHNARITWANQGMARRLARGEVNNRELVLKTVQGKACP